MVVAFVLVLVAFVALVWQLIELDHNVRQNRRLKSQKESLDRQVGEAEHEAQMRSERLAAEELGKAFRLAAENGRKLPYKRML